MKDRAGEKYNMLTIVSFSHRVRNVYYWKCKCDCGNTRVAQYYNVVNGNTKDCGCVSKRISYHGLSKHKIYRVYSGMMQRCYNSNKPDYKYWGGKGVVVCDEWKNNKNSFLEWALKNGWEEGLDLDKDILGDGLLYSPETCCFVTRKVNVRNRSNSRTAIYNNQTKTIAEWCEDLRLPINVITNRIAKHKWTIERAFTQPIRIRN